MTTAKLNPRIKRGLNFMFFYIALLPIPLYIANQLLQTGSEGSLSTIFAVLGFVRLISFPGYFLANSDILDSIFPSINFFTIPFMVGVSALFYFILGACLDAQIKALRTAYSRQKKRPTSIS